MKDLLERETRLIIRCSPGAAEYMKGLRSHPLYVVVIGRLEHKRGTLFELDIEHALADVVKLYPLRAQRPADH